MKKIILSLVLVAIFTFTVIFSHFAYADMYIQKLIDSSGAGGVVVDSSDNVYINEFYNHVIAKYDSNGVKYGVISGGQAVYGIGIDKSGNIYVSDAATGTIRKVDSNGNLILQFGNNGIGNAKLNSPREVTADSFGNIFVQDSIIKKFDKNGNLVTPFPSINSTDGVAVDSFGNLYVGSESNGISKFDNNGNFISEWGSQGIGNPVGYARFADITIDSHNIIYTNGKKFDINGTLLGSIPFPWVEQGIAVDSKGNLYGSGYELVINHSPVANNQTIAINEDASTRINITATDKDNDKILFKIKSNPIHGTLSGSNCGDISGCPMNNLVYIPYSHFVGQDSFTFLANDGYQDGNIGTVSITVNQIDHPPTAISSVGSVNENTPLQIVLTGNDIDNNKITYAIGTNPLHGTLGGFNSTTGAVIYTPNRDYVGNDNFTFTTSNRSYHSNIATFTLTVNPIPYTPTAIVGSDQTVSAGSTVSLDGSNSIDPYYDTIMKYYNFGQKQPIGNFLKYSWSQTGGIPVTLSSKTVSNPTFVAPSTPSGMILTFTLAVTDQGSNTSSPVTITIQSSSQPVQNATTPSPNNTVSVPTISNTGVTVSTDKSSYNQGDTITISTKLSSLVPNQAITIRVLNGFQNPVDIALLTPAPDGSATTKLLATGPLWQTSGTYTIMAQYNSTVKTLTAFYFNAGNGTASANNATNTQQSSAAITNATQMDFAYIESAKYNHTIVAEVYIGNQNIQTKSIDNNISIHTNNTSPDSINVIVSASNQTSPKVLLFNLGNTTINIGNLKYLGIMYDDKSIQPAVDVNSLLHAKSTDDPKYAIIVTQSGAQILVLIPHFSTHTITITNMSKVITAVPEFPFALLTLIIATFSIVLIPKIKQLI